MPVYSNMNRSLLQTERQRLERQLQDLNQREMQMNQMEQQYQQMNQIVQQPLAQAQNRPQASGQGYCWVDGEQAARSWIVNPGETVLLMDSNATAFYLKSADGTGKPLPLRIFDYTERMQEQQNPLQNAPQSTQTRENDLDTKYVKREEYEDLRGKYEALFDRVNNFSVPDTVEKPKPARPSARNKGGNDDE